MVLGGQESLTKKSLMLGLIAPFQVMRLLLAQEHGRFMQRLPDFTGNADVLVGTSEVNPAGENVQTRSIVSGRFDIPAGQALEIWHWCGSTRADTGLGYAVNIDSKVEVYTEVHLHKITD